MFDQDAEKEEELYNIIGTYYMPETLLSTYHYWYKFKYG